MNHSNGRSVEEGEVGGERNPYKLTDEVRDRLLKALRVGCRVEAAARYAGISRRTFYQWLKWGRERKTKKLRNFYTLVQQARGNAEVHATAILHQAMAKDWRAALAFLTRLVAARRPGDRASSSHSSRSRRTPPLGEVKMVNLWDHYTEEEQAECLKILHQIGAIELPPEEPTDQADERGWESP